MTKNIIDPQVKELIERLNKLILSWRKESNSLGDSLNDFEECADDLKHTIDWYLNQPGPNMEPPDWDNHDFAMNADGKDVDGYEINDCLTCKYRHNKPSMFGIACKNKNPCDWYNLWESKDE